MESLTYFSFTPEIPEGEKCGLIGSFVDECQNCTMRRPECFPVEDDKPETGDTF